jgi:hypothetical protein
MRKSILAGLWFLAGIGVADIGKSLADYSVPIPTGQSLTVMTFACQTFKLCPAHVLIRSDGTEIGNTSNPVSTNVQQFGGIPLSPGQSTMSNSLPVAIAADQATHPVTIGDTAGNAVGVRGGAPLITTVVSARSCAPNPLTKIPPPLC